MTALTSRQKTAVGLLIVDALLAIAVVALNKRDVGI